MFVVINFQHERKSFQKKIPDGILAEGFMCLTNACCDLVADGYSLLWRKILKFLFRLYIRYCALLKHSKCIDHFMWRGAGMVCSVWRQLRL